MPSRPSPSPGRAVTKPASGRTRRETTFSPGGLPVRVPPSSDGVSRDIPRGPRPSPRCVLATLRATRVPSSAVPSRLEQVEPTDHRPSRSPARMSGLAGVRQAKSRRCGPRRAGSDRRPTPRSTPTSGGDWPTRTPGRLGRDRLAGCRRYRTRRSGGVRAPSLTGQDSSWPVDTDRRGPPGRRPAACTVPAER